MKAATVSGVRPRFQVLSNTIAETPRTRSSKRPTPSLLSVSIAAAIGSMASGAFTPSAYAQEPVVDEITVTGSRIVRRDQTSNSPIITIEADQFESQNGLNFEAYLNQLPTYNPAASPTTTQFDVQITPVNSVGIASISLRGFGPNRNLVLIDGRRTVPVNALMVTDVNSIPSALIARVETITGGASAVYGADAVGGVTNFILRDDYEGFEVDAQYGVTDEGGGEEQRVSAVFGTNFEDGRGNIAMGIEGYWRESVLEVDRDAYVEKYNDPYAMGTFGFLQGTTHYNCLFACPSAGAINGVFNNSSPTENVFSPAAPFFRQFNFNGDATSVFVNTSQLGMSQFQDHPNWGFYPSRQLDGSIPGTTGAREIDGLKYHNAEALVSAPQDRYSFFTSGTYDFTDKVRLFARGTFAESETRTVLFGTNAIFGWETHVQYNPTTDSPLLTTLNYNDAAVVAAAVANPTSAAYANPSFIPTGAPGAQHPVPVELAALLNSRAPHTYCLQGGPGCGALFTNTVATPNAALVGTVAYPDWQPGWSPDTTSLGSRRTVNTNSLWNVEAGLTFDLGAAWNGEFYYAHGQSQTYNQANGNMSLTRYRWLARSPDYGRNAAISGNTIGYPQIGTPASPGFGAADITCTSGFYDTYFRADAALSPDCFQAVNSTLETRAQNTQQIIELNFEGPLFELPAGEVRMAVGYQGRENQATFTPDILQSTVSFTDQVIGVYPTGYLDQSTSVDDVYAEFLIPLLADRAGFRSLELELGFRASDYEHTEQEDTYKALISWGITDWFRLRGGFNRATRAPNLGELFLNRQEIFTIGGNNYGDPCGVRSTAPFGAGGTGPDAQLTPGETNPNGVYASGQTPQGAQSARLICEAAMGVAGANNYYNVANAPNPGGGLFNWVQQQGNSELVSETADSWTWGFVMNSPFEGRALNGLSLSLDYYRVDIQDAIMLFSVDYANFRCFGSVSVANASEAAAQAATPACRNVARNQALGGPLTTAVSYDNQAWIKTSGADIGLNWNYAFSGPSGIGINLTATWLDYYTTKQSPAVFDVETEWKGSLGPNLTGTNPGAYEYRLFGGFNYFRNDWSVNLRWRYLPGVNTAQYASIQAIIDNNARVLGGGEGIVLSYSPTQLTEIETDSYSIFDASFNWNITDRFRLRGGVTNLLAEEPLQAGELAGIPIGTNLAGVCQGAAGCVAPTAYSLPSKPNGYNGGYYDTNGRRYFLGFDVSF